MYNKNSAGNGSSWRKISPGIWEFESDPKEASISPDTITRITEAIESLDDKGSKELILHALADVKDE
ncbi:hypothetical protein D4S03_01450 [bacterium]|nr:MAG: hypothetical protein D4S03_01450 [bacterium]